MPSPHPISGIRASRYIQSLPCVDPTLNRTRTNAHPAPRGTATLYFSRLLKISRCTNRNWPHPPVKNQSQISPPSDCLGYDLSPQDLLRTTPAAQPLPSPWTPCLTGGGERDRTDDLMLAKHALSQLSYTPFDLSIGGSGWIRTIDPRLIKTVL